MMDYRELLKKFMQLVDYQEGTLFLGYDKAIELMNKEELAELERISEEIRTDT